MDVDAIISALSAQVECYRRLVKLAEMQRDHVRLGQTQMLLEVLARRQGEMDRLASFDGVLGPVRKNWGNWLAGPGVAMQSQAQALLDESRRLLEQITASDRNDAMALQQQRLTVGRELNQTSTATNVNRKFAAAAYGKPVGGMDVRR